MSTALLSCSEMIARIASSGVITECDQVRDGAVRMATAFTYPNGDGIDIFLNEDRAIPLFPGYLLSDYGQTVSYLQQLRLKPWSTKRRQQVIGDICESLDVKFEGGEFNLHFDSLDTAEMGAFVLRLVQACIRLADMSLMHRIRSASSFREEVEEFLLESEVDFKPDVSLPGEFGDVKLDFETKGNTVTSLVQTVSAANTFVAHSVMNETFRKWYDLRSQRTNREFITLVNSDVNTLRNEDLERLRDWSAVIGFPAQREEFLRAIAA